MLNNTYYLFIFHLDQFLMSDQIQEELEKEKDNYSKINETDFFT